jgi:hypothetical protein
MMHGNRPLEPVHTEYVARCDTCTDPVWEERFTDPVCAHVLAQQAARRHAAWHRMQARIRERL